MLSEDLTIEVVGEAGDADEAVALAARLEPDVVVMDVRMPGRSGVEACREIRAARDSTKVLMLTSFADDEVRFKAIMAGAAGYVLKQIDGSDLVDAIHKVSDGQSLLDPAVTSRVLAHARGQEPLGAEDARDNLTPQEQRIVTLLADGLTNRQIAEKVNLAENTAKNYVSSILMKLGLSRRSEVAALLAKRPTGNDAQDWS